MADEPVKVVKSGWKSSEFLIAMAGNVAAILATVGGVLPPKWAAVALAISNGLYAVSRGIAKQ